tara:strand:- start:983 stop:1216 length:234 start_codon:yes stop_codon:yes gene_type:complete
VAAVERVTMPVAVVERVDIEQPRVFLYPPEQLVELPWVLVEVERQIILSQVRMAVIQYFQPLHQPAAVEAVLPLQVR